jgi:hypothetical protein
LPLLVFMLVCGATLVPSHLPALCEKFLVAVRITAQS